MAKNSEVDPKKLRQELLSLADSIIKLDADGELLEASPELIQAMGDLRAQLFEYEVRCTGRLLPSPKDLPEIVEAQRIVDEAAARLDEEEEEWWRRWSTGQEESGD